MYLLQGWFNLSDEGMEDAIYDSYAMRKFIGLNFMQEGALDASVTVLKNGIPYASDIVVYTNVKR